MMLEGLPFVVAGVTASKLNRTRIVEAVIIGVIVAGMVAVGGKFWALPVLEERLDNVIADGRATRVMVQELSKDVKEDRVKRDQKDVVSDAKIVAIQIELARMRR